MAGSVLLQLPDSLKNRIHKIIREGAHFRHFALGAVLTGFLVTLLESVCTGQVYLPALVLLAKQNPSSVKWISYLVLYNLMFIGPLIVIFVAAYAGTGLVTMLSWSKRDVVIGKILMGLLFIGLAVLMLLL
jgi:cytochrome c biogenesis protein CcdA